MFKKLLFIVLTVGIHQAALGTVLDSTGIEKKGGKTYIVHKVDPKETLYSISRRYSVSVDDIKKANENLTNDLKVGQILLIPSKYPASTAVVHPSSVRTHTVEAKETLYSISREYGVTVDELKKANPNVPVDDMKIGQVLIIPGKGVQKDNSKPVKADEKEPAKPAGKQTAKPVQSPAANPKTHKIEPKETLYALSRKYEVTVDDLKKANPGVDITDLQVGQVINIPPKSAITHADVRKVTPPETPKKEPIAVPEKKDDKKSNAIVSKPENNLPEITRDGYTKVNESGLVEMYDAGSDFHYALHKTAPIGTIIFVESSDNDQKVYVRVMGRLNNAGPGVIMKLSKKAFDKVSQGDPKVKVNSSYIP